MARLGFCGACPTETETSRREAGFHMVFLAYKPICTDFTFNLPCRGRSDSASAGRVPADAQLTTDKCVDGRSSTFFFAVLKMCYICPSK